MSKNMLGSATTLEVRKRHLLQILVLQISAFCTISFKEILFRHQPRLRHLQFQQVLEAILTSLPGSESITNTIITKDAEFANAFGLDIHIRTKIVRFCSFIKNAAIRIGNDILEVEGSTEPSGTENRYWINFEYQGELEEIGGFPILVKVQSPVKRVYEIDLDKQYPGAKLVIFTYNEFVRVRSKNADIL